MTGLPWFGTAEESGNGGVCKHGIPRLADLPPVPGSDARAQIRPEMELAEFRRGSHGNLMNRVHLGLAALQILSLVAIGWLWSENRSLRGDSSEFLETGTKSVAGPTARAEKVAIQGETRSSRESGAPKRNPMVSREDAWNDALRAETNRRTRSVSNGSSRAGGVGTPNDRLPEELPAIPETRLIAAPHQPEGDSLIVNGGFDGDLSPWRCEEGRVIRDPVDARNSLLEASMHESGFRLAQSFEPPGTKAPMSLSFRAHLSADTALTGFELMLLGKEDQPLAMTFIEAGNPGEWKKIEWKVSIPMAPASLRIGSSRGQGVVRIDDVRLERVNTGPGELKAQPSP